MNFLDEDEVYSPQRAWIFYTNKTSQTKYIEEQRLMVEENGKIKITSINPLSQESMRDLKIQSAEELKRSAGHSGIFPSKVLYMKIDQLNFKLVWKCKSRVQKLYFDSDLKIPNGPRIIPSLVFSFDDGEIDVFAVKEPFKRSINTKLYHAPFFNTDKSGHFCQGTARPKEWNFTDIRKLMQQVENVFFVSEFTHLTSESVKFKTNIINYWQSATDKSLFPYENLIHNGKTIEDLLGE